jgi:S1-C subfamily serine protease
MLLWGGACLFLAVVGAGLYGIYLMRKAPAEPAPPVASAPASNPATLPLRPSETSTTAVASLPLGANLSAEDIVSRYARSVALIQSPVGSGTGFVAGPKLVMTNYHVIAHSPVSQLKIYFPSSASKHTAISAANLIYADGKRDLAVLRADTAQAPLTPATGYSFKAGQNVVVIGNPGIGRELVLENAVSAGIMSTRLSMEGYDYYQMSIAINPGNSGGPVFDNTGAVVGVATLKARSQEGIAFAVPVADMMRVMNVVRRTTPAETEKITANHNLIAACRRVSLMSEVYLKVAGQYVEAMRDAPPGGQDRALADIRAQVQDKLRRASAETMGDIEPMVQAYLADMTLSKNTRDRITEAWAMYVEARTLATSPRQPLSTYEAALARATIRRKNAVSALQSVLGVDDMLDDD